MLYSTHLEFWHGGDCLVWNPDGFDLFARHVVRHHVRGQSLIAREDP